MPFFCKNDLNSLLTKLDPLSDTTISGKTSEAKVDLILFMVTREVAEFTQWISIQAHGMGVSDQQGHLSHKRTRIIYVH